MARATFQEILFDPTLAAGSSPRAPRVARLPRFLGGSDDAAERLGRLKVAVIGCGGTGRPSAIHLARLQIGTIWLIDPGVYKPESLLTQAIGPAEVSQPKASSTGREVKGVSPGSGVFVFDGPVQAIDPLDLAEADIIILATDNLTTEAEVGQRCLWLGQALFQASVQGELLVAQARFFGNTGDGRGACPACGFNHAEWEHLWKETTFSCQGFIEGDRAAGTAALRPTALLPTMSVSALCALAADLTVLQLLRHVLGLGSPLSDSLWQYCGYDHRAVVTPLTRNPDCPCDHVTWTRMTSPRPLGECSLAELATKAGVGSHGDLAGVSFTVDDFAFCESGRCACGKTRPVRRFLRAGQSVALLGRPSKQMLNPGVQEGGQAVAPDCDCGGTVFPLSFDTHRPAPAAVVRAVLPEPLRALGAGSPRWVLVRGDERAVLFQSPVAGRGCESAAGKEVA